ncbi:unnamed protein product [Adineta steineri]|uniref:G-protein coupled receptors family 1 profile domain-containing protein n=1 Tax=Adineta steineri TaxID=433720 RepID=A0A815EY83_9BILA|nr:unnamed protein product [Adineta steineri]CAF1318544.1 unnamed protein product [Adineta steineri]
MASITLKDIAFVNNTATNETLSYPVSGIVLSKMTRFWILLIFEVPSLFCCVLLLYYLCFDRIQRNALNNHVIIAILIFNFFLLIIDIPNYLTLFRLHYVWPSTPINCYIWLVVDIAGYYGLGILMAWASIERHILVFHHQWLNTLKKRIFIHYIPLAAIILYLSIFYTILIFFVPCDHTLNYAAYTCGGACAYEIAALSMYDGFVNGDIPCFVTTIFNILLVIRVIKQKQRLHQHVQWRKHRRMIIQLLACAGLFIVFNLPLVCIYVAQAFGVPYGATGQFEYFVYFLAYFIMLWMPFVCLGSSPEILSKIKRIMKPQRINTTITPH